MDQGHDEKIRSWVGDLEFERIGPIKRVLKRAVLNPLVNYIPSGAMKAALRFGSDS